MNRLSRKIAIVILAAGESSRMGQPKQLLPWGADLLINHIIKETLKVPSAGHYVVLGANHLEIKAQISPEIKVLINEDWHLGMGTSIAKIIQTIKYTYDAVQFVLVDQPMVDAKFLTNMQDSYLYNKHTLIASRYSDSIGVPALFDQQYFSELETLTDQGAKSILSKFTPELYLIATRTPFEDLDTLAQYKALYWKVFKSKPPPI